MAAATADRMKSSSLKHISLGLLSELSLKDDKGGGFGVLTLHILLCCVTEGSAFVTGLTICYNGDA